jgi:hypothetical protein
MGFSRDERQDGAPSRRMVLAGIGGGGALAFASPALGSEAAWPSSAGSLGPMAAWPAMFSAGIGELVANRTPLNPDRVVAYRWITGDVEIAAVGVEILRAADATCSVGIFHETGRRPSEDVVVTSAPIACGTAGVALAKLDPVGRLKGGAYWLGFTVAGDAAGLQLRCHTVHPPPEETEQPPAEAPPEEPIPMALALAGSGRAAVTEAGRLAPKSSFDEAAAEVPVVYVELAA